MNRVINHDWFLLCKMTQEIFSEYFQLVNTRAEIIPVYYFRVKCDTEPISYLPYRGHILAAIFVILALSSVLTN